MEKPISTLSDSKIARRILSVRGLRVMLDRDLAVLFGVSTKQLNQQVLRNRDRFPSDFMSADSRRRRIFAVANCNLKQAMGRAALSPVCVHRAGRVNVEIMRTFGRLRQILSSHAELARKLAELQRRYDDQFRIVLMQFDCSWHRSPGESASGVPPVGRLVHEGGGFENGDR
jgi:ORF6N domain-containing protein